MTFKLYYTPDETNKLYKTLELLQEVEGVIKENCSILNPILLLSDLTNDTIARCNFLGIPEFSRNYFVTDITSVRTNLWELKSHVDVLHTYAPTISKQTAVISRQEKQWNLYLDDGIFKTYQNPNIITKAFPSGFNTQNFVLAVAGG